VRPCGRSDEAPDTAWLTQQARNSPSTCPTGGRSGGSRSAIATPSTRAASTPSSPPTASAPCSPRSKPRRRTPSPSVGCGPSGASASTGRSCSAAVTSSGCFASTWPTTTRGARTVGSTSERLTRRRILPLQPGTPRGMRRRDILGGYLRSSNFHREVWARARVAAGLPGIRFHDLQHAAATFAAQTGATTKELMVRIGHATPAAALRYQHAPAERDQRSPRSWSASAAPPRARSGHERRGNSSQDEPRRTVRMCPELGGSVWLRMTRRGPASGQGCRSVIRRRSAPLLVLVGAPEFRPEAQYGD
jgi:hypothetical protein